MPDALDFVRQEVAIANRILANEGIIDAFGHISVRHPKDPNKYLMARHLPPGMVTPRDIVLFDLDSTPLTHADKPQYSERFIHGEIYKLRPEVLSVVHCHARSLIPFGAAKGARLRPMSHMCGFLGCGVPIFEIRNAGGNTDMLIRTPHLGKALADTLGDKNVVLMRGHGDSVVGPTLRDAVFRAYYTEVNARLQLQAVTIGGPINFLTKQEAIASSKAMLRAAARPWALWRAKALSSP